MDSFTFPCTILRERYTNVRASRYMTDRATVGYFFAVSAVFGDGHVMCVGGRTLLFPGYI